MSNVILESLPPLQVQAAGHLIRAWKPVAHPVVSRTTGIVDPVVHVQSLADFLDRKGVLDGMLIGMWHQRVEVCFGRDPSTGSPARMISPANLRLDPVGDAVIYLLSLAPTIQEMAHLVVDRKPPLPNVLYFPSQDAVGLDGLAALAVYSADPARYPGDDYVAVVLLQSKSLYPADPPLSADGNLNEGVPVTTRGPGKLNFAGPNAKAFVDGLSPDHFVRVRVV